jgi:DmsE family decaheme c-type cytochrome
VKVRSFTTIIFLVAAAWAQSGPPQTPANPTSPQYVGSAVCKTCHPDVWASFYKNPHYKSIASGTARPEHTGCEGCHGPGKAHVEARGGKATIVAFSELPPKGVLDNCLNCHAKDVNRAEIRRSEHTQNDVVCTSCHSIHRPVSTKALLAKKQADLCYNCHGPVRAQFNMPSKHRVNEGVMTCTDCHNPHGTPAPTWRVSARPRMVDQALANEEPCLKCHTDKRGPFLFEHAAVRVDGCESCHFPHGSTNARLLKRPVLFTICLECHNGAAGFGRTGSGIPTQSPSHNMADPRYRNCTSCHVRIHGSNADPQFFR